MRIIHLSKEQLIKFLFDSHLIIGMGSNGIISTFDNETLIKIHYKDIPNSYYSKDFTNVDKEIEEKLKNERKLECLGLSKASILKQLISHLDKSNSPLIEGLVMYNGYPIGIIMKKYSRYKALNEVLLELTNDEKMIVRDRIEFLLNDLLKNDIYVRDIKFDNFVINKDTLDVKIIDLDDQGTVVGNRAHAKEDFMKNLERFFDLYDSYIDKNMSHLKKYKVAVLIPSGHKVDSKLRKFE